MKKFKQFWPFIFIFVVWIILFRPFFLKGLLPIPADIITGVYYPWLDYKWGFAVGVPVKNPLLSDIPSILYPWRSFAVDEIRAGRWPLWNPYYFAGMPLLANFQSAVFSYVNFLFIFFPKALAWSLGVMLSPLLTMLGVYAFLRHKKLTQISSLLGGVVFSLSGFEIAWMEYNVHGHTALFLPLFLLVIDKVMEKKRFPWLFFLPLLVALQIFAGYVPIVIYSVVICFFYILFFYFLPQIKERKIDWEGYFFVFLFWAWGIVLASVQIFPGLELTKLSVRLTDPTVSASNASFLPVKNLVTAIAPDFFGNPATGNYFGEAFYDNFYFFIGTGTLILIFFSIFFLKKDKHVVFWFLILFFSFLLCIKNPLGLILEKILFLSGGVAAKALFMADFSLAILSGYGMEKLLQAKDFSKRKIFFSISLAVIIFGIAFLMTFYILSPENRRVSERNLIIPAIFLFCCSVAVGIIGTTKSSLRKIVAFIFLVLVSVQLLYSTKKYLPFSKKELLFPSTPIIEFLQNKKAESREPFRVELGEVVPQNFLMPYGLQTTSGYDALLPKRTGEFLSWLETGKIQEKISRVQLVRNYDSPLFPLLNARYILAKKMDKNGIFSPEGKPPVLFSDSRYKLVFEDKTVQVYEDQNYLPRAFWVHNFVVADSPDDFVEFIKSNFDFSQSLILEKNINFISSKIKSKVEKIEWLDYGSSKINLIAESDQPGFVFLADSLFSGWEGFVDGRPVEIFRANFAFRAVLVGEGRHLITFEYRPKSFLYGGLFSVFGFANFILFTILFLFRKMWEKAK